MDRSDFLNLGDDHAAGVEDTGHLDLPSHQSFRLRGRKAMTAAMEELECEASDIVEAIAIANRHFGIGNIEIRCWRGRSYEVNINKDRSWSLKPIYEL